MQELNIVELIEKNPISKLSKVYNNKLINKIKENFNGFEQQLFVSSFYCYLNYDKNIDFVVYLDDIWKWLGFTQKISAIRVLEKHFKLDIDYKNLAPQLGGAFSEEENLALQFGKASSDDEKWGGHNKHKVTSSTGKKVEKVEIISGLLLNTWDTIAKAAEFENISAAKMSRSIKHNLQYNDYFYRIKNT
jgi:hypothetical protein